MLLRENQCASWGVVSLQFAQSGIGPSGKIVTILLIPVIEAMLWSSIGYINYFSRCPCFLQFFQEILMLLIEAQLYCILLNASNKSYNGFPFLVQLVRSFISVVEHLVVTVFPNEPYHFSYIYSNYVG